MRFDVARSTIQGNAKASVRGTSDEENPRFPFNFKFLFVGDKRVYKDYEYI